MNRCKVVLLLIAILLFNSSCNKRNENNNGKINEIAFLGLKLGESRVNTIQKLDSLYSAKIIEDYREDTTSLVWDYGRPFEIGKYECAEVYQTDSCINFFTDFIFQIGENFEEGYARCEVQFVNDTLYSVEVSPKLSFLYLPFTDSDNPKFDAVKDMYIKKNGFYTTTDYSESGSNIGKYKFSDSYPIANRDEDYCSITKGDGVKSTNYIWDFATSKIIILDYDEEKIIKKYERESFEKTYREFNDEYYQERPGLLEDIIDKHAYCIGTSKDKDTSIGIFYIYKPLHELLKSKQEIERKAVIEKQNKEDSLKNSKGHKKYKGQII